VMAVVYQGVALRLLKLHPGRLLRALVPAAAVVVGTLVGAGGVRVLMPGSDPIRLAASVLVGGALGLACLWVIDRRFIREVWRLIRRRDAVGATAGT
jgi:hypothetical protein